MQRAAVRKRLVLEMMVWRDCLKFLTVRTATCHHQDVGHFPVSLDRRGGREGEKVDK